MQSSWCTPCCWRMHIPCRTQSCDLHGAFASHYFACNLHGTHELGRSQELHFACEFHFAWAFCVSRNLNGTHALDNRLHVMFMTHALSISHAIFVAHTLWTAPAIREACTRRVYCSTLCSAERFLSAPLGHGNESNLKEPCQQDNICIY